MAKIGIRDLKALPLNSLLWDSGPGAIPGFCARRQKGEAITFGFKFRTSTGKQRWTSLGQWSAEFGPEAARKAAGKLRAEVTNGADPAARREAVKITMATLCERYMADCEAGRILVRGAPKRASTLVSDRSRLKHVIAVIGDRPVVEVTRREVEDLMHRIGAGETAQPATRTKPRGVSTLRGGRGAATRTIGLLGAVFAYAVKHELRQDNPVRGIERFRENRRERRLSDGEYARLGQALDAASDVQPAAIVRFLCLTGWRSGEALALRWQNVDLATRTAILPETKSGRSMRPLAQEVVSLLQSMPRIVTGGDDLVFPPRRNAPPGALATGFAKQARTIFRRAGLSSDITPHILRHSFASLGADLGFSEVALGALIGHRSGSITSRYVHYADRILLDAADQIASETGKRMSAESNARDCLAA